MSSDDLIIQLAKAHGAKTRNKKSVEIVPNDIEQFITHSKFVPDLTDMIPFRVLYYYYQQWKKNNKDNGFPEATKALFHKVCGSMFQVTKGRIYSYRASSELFPEPFKDKIKLQDKLEGNKAEWEERRYRKRQQRYQLFLDLKLEFEGKEEVKRYLSTKKTRSQV